MVRGLSAVMLSLVVNNITTNTLATFQLDKCHSLECRGFKGHGVGLGLKSDAGNLLLM